MSQTVVMEPALSEETVEDDIVSLVEALLLASAGPTTIGELAAGAGVGSGDVEYAIEVLQAEENRGWVVQRHGSSVQLATAPRFAEQVRRFLGLEREARLSAAALETLAIIAYQQPVTRSAVEAIRGVDCSGVLSTLLSRNVIESDSRADLPGQPYLYRTTPAFLQHFGLKSLDEMPALNRPDGTSLVEMLASAVEEADREEPGLLVGESLVRERSDAGEITNP